MSALLRLSAPICAIGLAAALLPAAAAQAAAGTTIRVSVATDGSEGEFFGSAEASISADGRYVAFSSGDKLAPNDTTYLDDVYLRDIKTGVTELISVGPAGESILASSNQPAVSANGRFVAFTADADLTGGDEWLGGTYLRDRQAGTTTRIGPRTYWYDSSPDISADGNFVVFSAVQDAVPEDTNHQDDVYLWQRSTGDLSVISTGADGETTFGASTGPTVSDDGRYVTYSTESRTLNGDVDGSRVVLTDRVARRTTVVSPLVDGKTTSGREPVISGDGNFVAYTHRADESSTDIFLWERTTGRSTPVTVNVAGRTGTGTSIEPAISYNGRYVAFWSTARDLVAAPSASLISVYRYDRRANRSVLAMTPPDDALFGTEDCAISDDGIYVASETRSATLVEGDTNGQIDVFRTQVSTPLRPGPATEPAPGTAPPPVRGR
jgi:hypothetical protein